MNAFHPDFIKTHYPDLMDGHRTTQRVSTSMTKVVARARKTNPKHGTMLGITKATPVSLKPLPFMVYSKAGMPSAKKKQIQA